MAVFAVALLAAGGMWLWWVPGQVAARLQARLALRGLRSHVGGVSAGLTGLHVSDLRIRGAGGDGSALVVRSARVTANPLALALRRLAAVQAVALTGVEVQLDVGDPRLAETISVLGSSQARATTSQGRASGGGAQSAPRLPRVSVSDLAVRVLDGHGTLCSARAGTARLEEGHWVAAFDGVTIGEAPGEQIGLKDVRFEGSVSGRRPLVRRVEVGEGTLAWVADGPDSTEGNDDLPPARGRTLARLLNARDALRALRRQGGGAPAGASAARAADGPLAPDLRLQLADLRVTVPQRGGGAVDVLTGLDVLVEGVGGGSYRARGGGREPSGGTLRWDLHLTPSSARVEGSVSMQGLPLQLVAPALPPAPWHDLGRSRFTGKLELQGTGLERVAARGSLAIDDIGLASERLAPTPVGPFSVRIDGDGTWIPAARRLELGTASVWVGSARVGVSGAMEWAEDHYLFDLRASLPDTPCGQVLASVPAGLLGELSQAGLDGSFAAGLALFVDSRSLDDTKVDFDIHDRCRFRSVPAQLALERFRRPFLHRVLEPDGTVFEMETGPGTPAWTAIENISPFMIQAVVAHEDGRFFRHRGFAEGQIAVALARNLKAGAYRYGASTITMQLVKNLFLHREKQLSRKVQEAFLTWWVERQLSKRDILELYLNVIEYGPDVYGIRNAAWHYFGLAPRDLSPAQAAFLATVLPNPKRFHASIVDGRLPEKLRARVERFVRHMHARERIDDAALQDALEELADFKLHQPGDPAAAPRQVTGAAKPPPFSMEPSGFNAWELPDDVGLPDPPPWPDTVVP